MGKAKGKGEVTQGEAAVWKGALGSLGFCPLAGWMEVELEGDPGRLNHRLQKKAVIQKRGGSDQMWCCIAIILAVGGIEAKGLLRIKMFFFSSHVLICVCVGLDMPQNMCRGRGYLLELALPFHSVVTEFRFNGMAADLRPAQVLL